MDRYKVNKDNVIISVKSMEIKLFKQLNYTTDINLPTIV